MTASDATEPLDRLKTALAKILQIMPSEGAIQPVQARLLIRWTAEMAAAVSVLERHAPEAPGHVDTRCRVGLADLYDPITRISACAALLTRQGLDGRERQRQLVAALERNAWWLKRLLAGAPDGRAVFTPTFAALREPCDT